MHWGLAGELSPSAFIGVLFLHVSDNCKSASVDVRRWCALRMPSDKVKAINNGSACSVLFLSTTGLFPARRKILEHETLSSDLTFF